MDPLVYATFSRVMAQVEGGDLLVVQRGQQSSSSSSSSSSGWVDGPWWRQATAIRTLGTVQGISESQKLCKASAESFATEYYQAHGGLELAAKQATEDLSESNPVRTSDIFLAVQAANFVEHEAAMLAFSINLHDPVHGITLSTTSQSMPETWTNWLDASVSSDLSAPAPVPQEIADLVHSGGVDPREWIAEWMEEVLSLGMGIIAQRYVAQRMGVGAGGMSISRARQAALETGGGEAARAI